MKKVTFSIGGKGFDIELENEFAEYARQELQKNGIAFDRNNDIIKLLNAYFSTLKKNYDTDKKIESMLLQISQ